MKTETKTKPERFEREMIDNYLDRKCVELREDEILKIREYKREELNDVLDGREPHGFFAVSKNDDEYILISVRNDEGVLSMFICGFNLSDENVYDYILGFSAMLYHKQQLKNLYEPEEIHYILRGLTQDMIDKIITN